MIPVKDLAVRGVYRMSARNLKVAVFDGKNFIGVREKFGDRYLDAEVPIEHGGTARPEELIGTLPESIGLERVGPTVCETCKKPAKWMGPPAPAPWVCEGGCENVNPVHYQNATMFQFLEEFKA